MSEAQLTVGERLAITRKVRDAMASAQDNQKQYADQHGRKNNDKVLLSTATLPKNSISVLHGSTTKLLSRFIGPFTVLEEVGDINYRLTLPLYIKTHSVFYVGRLKRYVDPQEITYPHRSNDTDGDTDCDSSVAADQATGKTKNYLYTSEGLVEYLESVEDFALDAGSSSSVTPKCPNKASGGHTSMVLRLRILEFRHQSRDPKSVGSEQRSQPASERQQGRQPREGGRNRRSYRATPALVDSDGYKRFLVERLFVHRYVKQKVQILV